MEIKNLTTKNLLELYANIVEELRSRKIVRTKNNIVADYAEYLVAKNLNLELMPNSNKHFDAIDNKTNYKFQIKSRRITNYNKSKLLGVVRDLDFTGFDYLVVVYFDINFKVIESFMIPKEILKIYSKYNKLQNGYRISSKVFEDASVKKINL
ncbi:MAG: hypothetical protein BWX82_00666 [Parcubacteria group bacterium ADurb.Bin115]|nr:MAG: hypothetical protein BWX82_00666 [Parcubacteria group bacterium ADurb.Bin115]